jgi:SAM-dependent methyltransferase
MKLLRMIKSLLSQEPLALAAFMHDLQSFVRVHFLYSAVETGLLECLNKPTSRKEVLVVLQVARPELLDALLDVGVAVGELAQQNGLYRLRGRRSRALVGKHREMFSGYVEAQVTYYNSVYRHAPERIMGAPLGRYLEEIGEVVAQYSELAKPFVGGFVEDRVAGRRSMRILDVGCGSGTYLRVAVQANNQVEGIGFEVNDRVAQQAKQNLDDWGLADRFRIVVGDILNPPHELAQRFDLIGLYNIIYYFDHDQRSRLFEKLRSMLTDHGMIAIVTNIRAGGKDLFSANLNLATSSMVGCTPLPTLKELSTQLKESGFREITNTRLIPSSYIYGIVAQ